MNLKKTLTISLACATSIYAAGYKIPEQSLNAVALSAAYVANASGADASYYNPANMAFSTQKNELDLSLTYISLPKMKFSETEESKAEEFLLPTFHYVRASSNENIKYGISFVAPAGLSKRWDTPSAKTYSEEFTLQIVELNPTMSYRINDNFAIGGGLRVIYTKGIVKSDGTIPVDADKDGNIDFYADIKRDMQGDDISYGYNLALTYKVTPKTTIATTYRSNVDLNIEGNAKLTYSNGAPLADSYLNSPASVKIPLPASLNLAIAHKFENLTIEAVYEKTFWSKYKELDFNYTKNISNAVLKAAFDDSKNKSWKDTNTYRIGATYKYSPKLILMGAVGIDESPVPTETIGFELPDSDAKIISAGFEYKLDNSSSFGLAYLISFKDDKKVSSVNDSPISGEFTNSKVSLLTLGYTYKF